MTLALCCDIIQSEQSRVMAGDHDLTVAEGNEQVSEVISTIIHENYSDLDNDIGDDICIVKVKTPFVFGRYTLGIDCMSIRNTGMCFSVLSLRCPFQHKTRTLLARVQLCTALD